MFFSICFFNMTKPGGKTETGTNMVQTESLWQNELLHDAITSYIWQYGSGWGPKRGKPEAGRARREPGSSTTYQSCTTADREKNMEEQGRRWVV